MKIGIIGSMQFADKMREISEELKKLGHNPILSTFIETLNGKNLDEIEYIKLEQKFNDDAMRKDWENIKDTDAVLVLNYDKNNISNYIGGNTLFEIGFAYLAKKKIFLLNPIPEIPYYKTEIEAVKPVIINGDLSLIK